MLAIIDYGVGNLFSLASSFKAIGAETVVTDDAEIIKSAERIVLPGVGAFSDAVNKLRSSGLDKVVLSEAAQGKPLMGICLGMQMLFEKSYEYGEYEGLGLIKGKVKPLLGAIPEKLKIPHIGWNELHFPKDKEKSNLFKYIKENECVYFVHSYYGADCDSVIATAEYGKEITAAVAEGNIYGCQFHPEKSGNTGLNILKGFMEVLP